MNLKQYSAWSKEINNRIIERLRVSFREANDELGHYKKRNAKLQAVVDAAKEVTQDEQVYENDTTYSLMKMEKALAALEDSDDST